MKMKEYMTEANWVKGLFAGDANGDGCDIEDTKAEKFCLIGAAFKCYPNDVGTIRCLLDKELGDIAVSWNDAPGRTFEEVRALVEKLDI